jgi:hypothetical protein
VDAYRADNSSISASLLPAGLYTSVTSTVEVLNAKNVFVSVPALPFLVRGGECRANEDHSTQAVIFGTIIFKLLSTPPSAQLSATASAALTEPVYAYLFPANTTVSALPVSFTEVGPDGRYEFPPVPVGTYRLVFRGADIDGGSTSVTVSATEIGTVEIPAVQAPAIIRVETGCEVRGLFSDITGVNNSIVTFGSDISSLIGRAQLRLQTTSKRLPFRKRRIQGLKRYNVRIQSLLGQALEVSDAFPLRLTQRCPATNGCAFESFTKHKASLVRTVRALRRLSASTTEFLAKGTDRPESILSLRRRQLKYRRTSSSLVKLVQSLPENNEVCPRS